LTRQEQTGKRDLHFSQWVRDRLPDSSTGFWVSDVDFILYNKNTKRMMLLEVKTRNGNVRPWQRELFSVIDSMLRLSAPHFGIEYKGWHVVKIEGVDPNSGAIYLDDKEMDRDGLRFYLSME
jgi:hypothetical protein